MLAGQLPARRVTRRRIARDLGDGQPYGEMSPRPKTVTRTLHGAIPRALDCLPLRARVKSLRSLRDGLRPLLTRTLRSQIPAPIGGMGSGGNGANR